MSAQSPQRQFQNLRFTYGSVVSYCPVASSIGVNILQNGGNAVDAAVATGLALAVTYPQAGNLGGGGFLLLRLANGDLHFVDYRERAGRRVRELSFIDDNGVRSENALYGGAPVCVPGTVAGLGATLERFGTWSWDRVVGAVVDLAAVGHWVTSRQAAYFRMYEHELSRFESTRKIFCDPVPMAGTLWRQPDLAWTLRELAEHGPEAFYKGAIAERMIDSIRRHGGLLDETDFVDYEPKWRTPIHTQFAGRSVISAPLPSGGGLVIRVATTVLEACSFRDLGHGTPDYYFLLARAFRIAFELRRRLAGDPDTMDRADYDNALGLLSRSLELAANIDALERSLDLDELTPGRAPDRSENTTHFCVVDRFGNAVSNTYSLNTLFGSKLVPDGCGFLFNNSIDDFSLSSLTPNYYGIIEDGKNEPRPGARPTGSMAPTIAVDDTGNIELLLGASGGPRIPTVVTQLLCRCLGDGEILPVAMRSPRVHHQLVPDRTFVEPMVRAEVKDALGKHWQGIIEDPKLGIGCGIQRTGELSYEGALDFRFSQQG